MPNSSATPIMGLDVGQVRIGVSMSDPLRLIAGAHSVLVRKNLEKDFRTLEDIVREKGVNIIVVGHPKTLKGKISESTRRVEKFARSLQQRLPEVTVKLWDERLSTVQAEATLRESNLRGKKRRQVIDKVAAALILQNYLDYLNKK